VIRNSDLKSYCKLLKIVGMSKHNYLGPDPDPDPKPSRIKQKPDPKTFKKVGAGFKEVAIDRQR
jgi:hypothetical protein